MRHRLRSEAGVTIVPVIVLTTVMIGIALAALSFVDDQSRQSGVERQREGALNFGEGVLNTQAFILSRKWPGRASAPQPDCTAASVDVRCPSDALMREAYASPDITQTSANWSTSVRDDDGTPYYAESTINARPAWDANGNKKVWLRAEGEVDGRRRSFVAQVQVELLTEQFPRNTVIAGRFATTNNGQKTIVETNSTATSGHDVIVRCDPLQDGCLDYNQDSTPPQVNPPDAVVGGGYVDKPVIPPDRLARLRERAQADGTYYPAGQCPPKPEGAVVWIEATPAGGCNYNNSAMPCCNSPESPGLLIIGDGKVEIGGSLVFYGIIYHLNLAGSADADLVKIQGTAAVQGGVFVDGPGGVTVGSSGGNPDTSKANLVFDENAFSGVSSYGNAGVLQNSWREVK